MDGWGWMKNTEMQCCGNRKQNPLTLYQGGSGKVSREEYPGAEISEKL